MRNMKRKEKDQESATRREFLKILWRYLGIIALLETGVVSFSLMGARSSRMNRKGKYLKTVGSLSDLPPGTVMPIRSGRFYIIRLEDGGLMAVSMVCPHLGCTVNWDSVEHIFKCPCHSSAFDRFGNVIKSPATKTLNYFKVLVENGKIKVDLEHYLVRKKFDPSVVTYV